MASRLGQLLDVAYTIEYGAQCSVQSSLNMLYLPAFSGQGQLRIVGPSNEKYHVRGGNEQIASGLAALLPQQIQLGTALTALVSNADDTWTLVTRSGATTTSRVADHVVLALPFSLLRRVDLTKARLPRLKTTAINQLAMGTNSKLALQFSDRRWRSLGGNGDTFADTGYQSTWEVTRAQPGTSGVLVDFTGGTIGASLTGATPQTSARRFLGQIEPLHPGLSARWNGKVTLDAWSTYPWALGSYSYWRVGQYTGFSGVEGAGRRHVPLRRRAHLAGLPGLPERSRRDRLPRGRRDRGRAEVADVGDPASWDSADLTRLVPLRPRPHAGRRP